ncbi:hypothetical protein [Specibacter sp. RAF43]|uniref:hypothetical protein n=1 Tax=Specibacter sp. RAF43 TaxID=3233057 RepID=UPI003F9CDD31
MEQTHLNTVFDVNLRIDNDNTESDRCIEFTAYPLTIIDSTDAGNPAGTIDASRIVALLQISLTDLAWDEQETGALENHCGWTTIGINADCWSPEEAEILFGPKLAFFVTRVLVEACQNELNGNDVEGHQYRTPGTSGRRGLQRCRALATTLKNQVLQP